MIGRKLATIRRIGSIRSIPEAVSIVCAEIDGWKAIIQKGQFEEGAREKSLIFAIKNKGKQSVKHNRRASYLR